MKVHVSRWSQIWQSRFDIQGNCLLSAQTHAAYYYVLSSMPLAVNYDSDGWPFFGIGPGGLAVSDNDGISWNYHGHVFWDQDLWVLVGLLPLYPDVVKTVHLDSRVRNLDKAMLNAKNYGGIGARFPWEQAYSGYEVCPAPDFSRDEIHVTGDSALSAKQYLMLTG